MIDWTPEVTELLTRLWVAGKSGAPNRPNYAAVAVFGSPV